MKKNIFRCYEVVSFHFGEFAEHHGYFRNLDNAITKAKEVVSEKQKDLELMRSNDNGVSYLYEKDFEELPITHKHTYFYMASQTESVSVSEHHVITED